jgi:hypothetical protein
VRKDETVGFKDLTPANWIDADPVSTQFWRESRLVGPTDMDAQAWARAFLGVDLTTHVPADVRELFAVARGVLLYGWFFYPLFRLGEDQLHRVLEAAVVARYRQLDGPKSRPSYAIAIEYLVERAVIPAEDLPRWNAARELRNRASHLHQQVVMPPGAVLDMLKATAHDINRLFARDARTTSVDEG